MAPDVTSTSLPCHLIRVWHKHLNLTGLCFARLLLWEMIPPTGSSHTASPECRDHQPGASPRGMGGTRHRVFPQIQLFLIYGAQIKFHLFSPPPLPNPKISAAILWRTPAPCIPGSASCSPCQ